MNSSCEIVRPNRENRRAAKRQMAVKRAVTLKAKSKGVCIQWATEGFCENFYNNSGTCCYAHSWPDEAVLEKAKKQGVCLNFAAKRDCWRNDCTYKHFWPEQKPRNISRRSDEKVSGKSQRTSGKSQRRTSSMTQGLSLREQRKLNVGLKRNGSAQRVWGQAAKPKPVEKSAVNPKMKATWTKSGAPIPVAVKPKIPVAVAAPQASAVDWPGLPTRVATPQAPAVHPRIPTPVATPQAPAVQPTIPTPVATPQAPAVQRRIPTPVATPQEPAVQLTISTPAQVSAVQPRIPTPVATPQAPVRFSAVQPRTPSPVETPGEFTPVSISPVERPAPQLYLPVPFQPDLQAASPAMSIADTNMDTSLSITATESGGSLYQAPLETALPQPVRPPMPAPRQPQLGMQPQMFAVNMSGEELRAWQNWKFQMAQSVKAMPASLIRPVRIMQPNY